jgi:hypothetical protein
MSNQFKNYESEFTIFMRELHVRHPDMEAAQAAGRALLWDRMPVLLSDQQRRLDSIIKQQAYPYQVKAE